MKKFFIGTASVLAIALTAVGLMACGKDKGQGDGHAHSLVKHEAVAKTCTTEGNKLYWECSDCGKLYLDEQATNETTSQAVVIAAGHTEQLLPGKDATCAETGLTEGAKCSVCNEILVAQNVIPVDTTAHDFALKSDESEHWYECTYCEEEKDREAHKGGAATTEKKAECEVCGAEYGDFAAPTPGTGPLDFTGELKKYGANLAVYAGCELQQNGAGHNGYIFGAMTSGATITFTINSLVEGAYELCISVAGGINGAGSGWTEALVDGLEIFVNEVSLGTVDVGPTGWTGFSEISMGDITLKEGENVITLVAGEGATGNCNFSYISIGTKPVKEAYNGTEQIYGASEATVQNCSIEGNGAGYDGNIIGGIGEGSSYTFTVESAVEADVTLSAFLAGGERDDNWAIVGEQTDAYEILVNGVSVGKIDVGTWDWTNFTEIVIGTAKLNAGTNTIEFRALGGQTNFSHLKIAPATV